MAIVDILSLLAEDSAHRLDVLALVRDDDLLGTDSHVDLPSD